MNGDPKQSPPAGWQFKPDATTDTAPVASPAAPAPVAAGAPVPPTIAPDTPQPTVAPASPAAPAPSPEAAPSDVPTGIDVARTQPGQATNEAEAPLRWAASESAHIKPQGWLGMLAGGTVLLAVVVFLLTRDAVNAGAIIAAGLLFGIYSSRKPQTVHYQLDDTGITIGHKHYPYNMFRSFAVEEGSQTKTHGLVLMPLRRFMPMLSMHYASDLEEEIVDELSARLPMEAFRRDAVDAISRKLKF